MILVDANLLIYAKGADLPQHRGAAAWFESVVQEGMRLGLPWMSLLAFLRVSTNPRLFTQPLTMTAAWAQVEEWLSLPGVWVPQPTEQHPRVFGHLLVAGNATGNLVPDAHLAALAIEHGLELCTADSDFARFPGVRWRNPLVEGVREARARYRARGRQLRR
jgi:uncharacterized protein